MKSILFSLCITGFVISAIGSSILYRYASQSTGMEALKMFAIGTVVGFLSPICLTLALARGNANIVYALTATLAFAGIQLTSYLLFKEPLSKVQIAGIIIMAIGVLMTAVGKSSVN